jgi:hypothetical protein
LKVIFWVSKVFSWWTSEGTIIWFMVCSSVVMKSTLFGGNDTNNWRTSTSLIGRALSEPSVSFSDAPSYIGSGCSGDMIDQVREWFSLRNVIGMSTDRMLHQIWFSSLECLISILVPCVSSPGSQALLFRLEQRDGTDFIRAPPGSCNILSVPPWIFMKLKAWSRWNKTSGLAPSVEFLTRSSCAKMIGQWESPIEGVDGGSSALFEDYHKDILCIWKGLFRFTIHG